MRIENGWLLTKAPTGQPNPVTGQPELPKSIFCKDLPAIIARLKEVIVDDNRFSLVEE